MNKNILVIDDEAGIRTSFVLALEDTGYHVDTAESGEVGVEKEKSKNYNLIFLDLKMPGMNGVDVLRKIREGNKKVPIYLVTAFHKEFFAELKIAIKEGVEFELLKKPIDSQQILQVVKSVFESSTIY